MVFAEGVGVFAHMQSRCAAINFDDHTLENDLLLQLLEAERVEQDTIDVITDRILPLLPTSALAFV